MDWNAVAAIGQILGSLAVFITLGYLAVQLRQSRRETQRLIRQGQADASSAMLMTWATTDLSAIEGRANTAMGAPVSASVAALVTRAGLTEGEARSLVSAYNAQWLTRQQFITYADELTTGQRAFLDASIRNFYGAQPASRLWYETNKPILHDHAVRYVDAVLTRRD